MYVLTSDKTVFFDVDDTLVIWEGTSYRPHNKHIELLKRFVERGQPVVVWSAGGYEWAERVVKELNLEGLVTAVMAKPQWWVDDLTANEVLFAHSRIYLKEQE
jgi:hydroxymethylpyrimidine pyrophosphatase-like HAD family hydrolase